MSRGSNLEGELSVNEAVNSFANSHDEGNIGIINECIKKYSINRGNLLTIKKYKK